jgi:tropinone reductase I
LPAFHFKNNTHIEMSKWKLDNKKVLITGGTKGIGRATVEEFISLGAEVLFTGRTEEDIVSLEQSLKNKKATGLKLDVTKQADTVRLKSWIEENWGKLDVLVNNAGTNIRKASDRYSTEEYDLVLNTNITAPFLITTSLFACYRNQNQLQLLILPQ